MKALFNFERENLLFKIGIHYSLIHACTRTLCVNFSISIQWMHFYGATPTKLVGLQLLHNFSFIMSFRSVRANSTVLALFSTRHMELVVLYMRHR
jgi:hypothetical protein